MLYFRNDYGTGAHPAVLEALCGTNMELTPGYGTDQYTRQAAETIRDLCGVPDAVHFLMGGTQANKTAIAAFLRPYEAVLAAASGHICVHEAGAVEQDGHAVLRLPAPDGKLTPELLRSAMAGPVNEHTVVPRLAYISNTTELGTVYTRPELLALRRCCDELGLYLYCDGARLGSAMDAGGTGFADYGACCHAFTIGGTKNGLLLGEALVIVEPALRPGFRNCMKQQGAMLAKGRLLGVQFEAVLRDGLYLSLAAHANAQAKRSGTAGRPAAGPGGEQSGVPHPAGRRGGGAGAERGVRGGARDGRGAHLHPLRHRLAHLAGGRGRPAGADGGPAEIGDQPPDSPVGTRGRFDKKIFPAA